jgi:hypothetical protein
VTGSGQRPEKGNDSFASRIPGAVGDSNPQGLAQRFLRPPPNSPTPARKVSVLSLLLREIKAQTPTMNVPAMMTNMPTSSAKDGFRSLLTPVCSHTSARCKPRAGLDGQGDKLRGVGPGELRPSAKLGHRVKTATVG